MARNVMIKGTGSYHPKNVVNNEYYIEHFKKFNLDGHLKGIMRKLGRNTRNIAKENENSLTMAVEAAKNALYNSEVSSEDIDMIIYSSDTPEFLAPTCSLLLKNQLKACNVTGVFDVNSNCTGMLTAIDIATRYLKTDKKYNKVLVVGSLLVSRLARKDDMITYGCTGDGAVAVVLEVEEDNEVERGILGSRMFADDAYSYAMRFPRCGLSNITKENMKPDDVEWLAVPFDFSFVPEKWAKLISKLLKDYNYTSKDVCHYFMSQFSKTDIELTMNKLGSSMDKITFVGDKYGYTGCTSPIMALDDGLKSNKFKKDDIVVFCSIATGYSMNSLLYKF
ncbi:3-oxoacyl-ACP synthase III family protein [Haloimpatiens sp. FM7330]|uniref:3-oxoacyl-ACP synthase III family protein n=1 Tax=Haloimpatiens sp. FM7330 TaxID=3298610 RepID=UPI00362AFF95